MKPHSWGWLCNSLPSLLSNYTSIWAKTNFTPASSDGIKAGVVQFLHPLLVASSISDRDVSGRTEVLVLSCAPARSVGEPAQVHLSS